MLFEKFEKMWKILVWIPIGLLVLSSIFMVHGLVTKGYFIQRDVELLGGKMFTIEADNFDVNQIKEKFPYAHVQITTGIRKNLLIQVPNSVDEQEFINELSQLVEIKNINTRIVDPILGSTFYQQAIWGLIMAFIFMGILVFILFRSIVPSSLVILAATTDIVTTLGIISFLDFRLSLPIIVALLTLIGYSVDTDILLTSELLKNRTDDISKRIKRAMKTGLTMSSTTIAALLAIFFISNSFVLQQIASVLIIGLLIDIISTWFTNAGFLKMWVERKHD